MRKHDKQAGFTIVELMIIMMIMGILASLVLPSIRLNSARAKVSEALLAAGPCKTSVSEVYITGGDLPAPGQEWGCESTGAVSKYVDSVSFVDDFGTIKISLSREFNDLRLNFRDITLAPLDNTGNIPNDAGVAIRRWRCGSVADGTDPLLLPFLPNTCRG